MGWILVWDSYRFEYLIPTQYGILNGVLTKSG
jgi:hypothetical protein